MADRNTLEQWYYDVPIVTRVWTTAVVATAVLVQCQVVSQYQLYYTFSTVFTKRQYWRLLSTFTYFGPLSWGGGEEGWGVVVGECRGVKLPGGSEVR